MQLCAVLTKEELVAVVRELTPFELELAGQSRRKISLGRPTQLELVAGAGLRVGGEARITWDALGLAFPIKLRRWQVLLVPSIAVRGGAQVLAFDPELEVLDLEHVPGFLDERIASAINDGLSSQKARLAWNFTRTLGWKRGLPARFAPSSRFELVPGAGRVEVTSNELRLSVDLRARVVRDASERQDSPSSRSARA